MGRKPESDTGFITAAATHVGHIRDQNEDRFLTRPEIGVWAVADGMGGHEAGAFASECVVKTLATIEASANADDLLRSCLAGIARANAEILQFSRAEAGATVGTTVAALLAVGRRFGCVWCGDSRIYRLRDGAIIQLSRDHTELQEFLDSGVLSEAEAINWPNRNVLTRAIGVMDVAPTEAIAGDLLPDDIFVICSDGLSTHVSDTEILEGAQRSTAVAGCRSLIDLALSRGGKDNVTVVIVQFKPDATRRMPSRHFGTVG